MITCHLRASQVVTTFLAHFQRSPFRMLNHEHVTYRGAAVVTISLHLAQVVASDHVPSEHRRTGAVRGHLTVVAERDAEMKRVIPRLVSDEVGFVVNVKPCVIGPALAAGRAYVVVPPENFVPKRMPRRAAVFVHRRVGK